MIISTHQPGILKEIPEVSRYLTCQLLPDAHPGKALSRLAEHVDEHTVVGLGHASVARLGRMIPGLREPMCLAGPEISFPATPAALWLWLRGSDRGELVHRTHALEDVLDGAYAIESIVDGFKFQDGRDLSGYVDGTENPKGEDAMTAAFAIAPREGLTGGSYVAVQTWVHQLNRLQDFSADEQDNMVGRSRATNEELASAPPSAHVKRTAQESFAPEAFLLRRSMPWADRDGEGLVFVAFGRSFDAIEAIQRRMVGLEDGITDALFRFTQPISASYFWCPPVSNGELDLSALDL